MDHESRSKLCSSTVPPNCVLFVSNRALSVNHIGKHAPLWLTTNNSGHFSLFTRSPSCMTGDRDWSAPNHMLDRLNWRYQFDYEICDPVIQLIAISARTAILLRAMFSCRYFGRTLSLWRSFSRLSTSILSIFQIIMEQNRWNWNGRNCIP